MIHLRSERGGSLAAEPSSLAGLERAASAAFVMAHSYVGVFHDGSPDPGLFRVLRRGLDLLRPPGVLASQLAPLVLVSPSALLAAWVRGPSAAPSPDPHELACEHGWIVVAGVPHPRDDASWNVWAERGLQGDWEALVGANGAYTCAVFDERGPGLGLAQDRFGLFRQVWTRRAGRVWFATSTNALAAVPGIELTPNPEQIAAMGMGLVLRSPDSPFRELTRPLANTLHTFRSIEGAPSIWEAPGCFPRDRDRKVPSLEATVLRLNAALLGRLRRVTQRPDFQSLAIWMTSGVDSRWMSAAARKLGEKPSYWTIGTPDTVDFDTARAYSRDLGSRAAVAVVDSLADVIGPLPETNWWLEGRVSLFHQFMGSIWDQMRAETPVMLQGYFMNWMKWILPKHAHRRAQNLGQNRSLQEAFETYLAGVRADARTHRAHLLLPQIEALAETTARSVLQRARPDCSYHFLLAMQLDGGPVERALALPRLSHVMGGADVPLMDTEIVDAALDATRIPYRVRRAVQPRCITQLDPVSGSLPSTPWFLPPRGMTGSVLRVAGHALANPLWIPRMIHARRSKSIYAYPVRMRILASADRLVWARRFLTEGRGRLAHAFGRGIEDFCSSVMAHPTHKGVGLLWGLVSLELYLEAFERASAGDNQPWRALELS